MTTQVSDQYARAFGGSSHANRQERDAALWLTVFLGLLLLSGIELTHFMEWGLQYLTRAAFGW